MTSRPRSSLKIVFILGLLAMLMPLSIDMYLPALPVISAQFGVPAGSAQMTLSTYILGFAVGQLLYGPMADSLGRKPVILGGTLIFAAAAVACALAPSIDYLITTRFFHGLSAAAASVVINALMRDIYPKEEFSLARHFLDSGYCGIAGIGDDLLLYRRNVAGRQAPAVPSGDHARQLRLIIPP